MKHKSYRELEEKFYREFLYPPICPACGEECEVIEQNDSFSYSGTHCTYGQSGTHYMPSYYISNCCEAEVEI